MTGREAFSRTIDFKTPGYVPHTIGGHPDFLWEKDEKKWERIMELITATPSEAQFFISCWHVKDERRDGVVYRTDEWGTKFEDHGTGMFSTYHPMEEGYEHIDRVTFPDANDLTRFDAARKAFAASPDCYHVGGVWFSLFERLWMLRGFDNMLMDPYIEEEDFYPLKERVMEVNLAMIDKWLELDVDAIAFSDDWGTQRGLLINPDDWRRMYKNDYKRMFDKVRSAGKHVMMHLCGNIISILPDLIELGLNVLNPVQPQAMDLEVLSREFRGKVCFNGGIDVQGVMITGTPAEVKAAVHRTIKLLSTPDGGYICAPSHSIMPETPLDNVIALLEAIAEYR